MYNVHPVIGVL